LLISADFAGERQAMDADISATVRMLEQLPCTFISCWFASGLAGIP